MLLFFLCAFSLLAGFVDSVVGGGGLIQIPAMLILMPGTPIATILGTNKFASCAGTTIAVCRYAQHVTFDWPTILPAAFAAFVFSFLIFLFVGVFGFDFLAASASAKVINLATNVASVIYFGWTGHIIYAYAVPMALCSILGAAIGARLAISKGSRFVRVFFLVVVGALVAKLAQSIIAP